jgi:hypothetical protein
MNYYTNEAGDTCEYCHKMAHFETGDGTILCQEHARKHEEYPDFAKRKWDAERKRSAGGDPR